MTFAAWFSVAAILLLGAISPGPSLAVVLKHTLQGSRRLGLTTALAHGAGVGLYALLVALGMASLLQQLPWLYEALIYAGAGYLVWLAWQALTTKASIQAQAKPQTTAVSYNAAIRDGFLVAFLNPKIALFFVALFAQFIPAEQPLQAKLLLAATAWLIDTGWYLLVAYGLSHSRLLPWLNQKALWINRAIGLALLLLALRVVTL